MGREKERDPVYKQITILDIGANGKAIAKKDNLVIFVSNALPGDVVDLQITKKRKNYLEGIPLHFHRFSSKRKKEFCEHFGICGGCKWQNLQYGEQLFYKQKQVADQLQRIGGIDPGQLSDILPIVPSDNTKYYRNKLEFTFSDNRWLSGEELEQEIDQKARNALGFHIPRMYDKVLDIKNCYLQPDPSNKIRLAVREYAILHDLDFFDIRNNKGFLRNLIIRTSSAGEIMVILSLYDERPDQRKAILDHLGKEFPAITSLMYVINSKSNDTITDQEILLHSGKDHIIEKMEDLTLKIGPKSFFQTNSDQALKLYNIIKDYSSLSGSETVYDLYTGTGTIANFIARNSGKVIGVDLVPEAINDAKINSEINHITNTTFISGDMKDMLTDNFFVEFGYPDLIILDPPRAGIHKKVIRAILQAKPDKIIYVSCNPATQARDMQLLHDAFEIRKIQPVDMFPHTHHVENIILLEKPSG